MRTARQVAIITGGSRGIGKAIAVCMAKSGLDIIINYRNNERAAIETVEQIRSMGQRAIMLQGDITSPDTASTLVRKTLKQFDAVDILVNNVGEFFFGRLAEMNYEEWQAVIQSNLSSVFYMCSAVLPSMRQQKRGQIINIGLSPTHIVRGAPHISAYAIAKTGVQILTRSLAIEEATHNIRVNCVSPGLIDNGYLPSEERTWMEQRVPLGRLGTPEDVANAVAFLISDTATYISGANLAVAGAWDWEDRPTNYDSNMHGWFREKRN